MQSTTEEGQTRTSAAPTPETQASVCLDPNLNSINISSSSPTDTTEGSLASAKRFYGNHVPTSVPQVLFDDKRPAGS